MPSDLPTLIARLREARPELAGSLPESRGFRWTIGQDMDRHELPSVVVEPILIGVCADELRKKGQAVVEDGKGNFRHIGLTGPARVFSLPAAPDFPSALVEAVIGEGTDAA